MVLFGTLRAHAGRTRPSPIDAEYDAQVCEVDHRYGHTALLVMVDRDKAGKRSLTNDIERALAHQVSEGNLAPGMLVIYRDSMKQWDQVLIDDECRFVDFRVLAARTRLDAITRALMMEYAHER
jgi:hypothetical protein